MIYFLFFPFYFESVLFLAIGTAVAVDYCKNMRCAEKPHVACNSPAANDVSAFKKIVCNTFEEK